MAHRSDLRACEIAFYTRNGQDWTDQFKVILDPLQKQTKGSALLEGEIVAVDKQGRPDFSMLKTGIEDDFELIGPIAGSSQHSF